MTRRTAGAAAATVGAAVAVEALVLRGSSGAPPTLLDVLVALLVWAAALGLVAAVGQERPRAAKVLASTGLALWATLWLLPLYVEFEHGELVAVPTTVVVVWAAARAVSWSDDHLPTPRSVAGLLLAVAAAELGLLAVVSAAPPEGPTLLALGAAVAVVGLGRWGGLALPLALLPGPAEDRWADATAEATGPDVVLVTVDTLRTDAAEGLAALAPLRASGVVLDGQSSSSWTVPSLASLHTGLEPERHGAGKTTRGFHALVADELTLAERLRQAGYLTAATVENPFLSDDLGLVRGFDRVRRRDAELTALPRTPMSPHPRLLEPALLAWAGLLPPTPVETSWHTADVEDFVADSAGRPLFLWVHLFEPHLPYRNASTLPDATVLQRLELMRLSARDFSDLERLPLYKRAYDHEVAVLDRRLETLLAALPHTERGRVVIFASDHGEEFGEHGGFEHGHTMYQELLSVPLIIDGIEGIPPQLAGLVDVVPTVMGALGHPVDGLDGRDLRHEAPRPVASSGMLYDDLTLRAVRDERLKVIAGEDGTRGFDLRADPGEEQPTEADPGLLDHLPGSFSGAGETRGFTAQERAQLEALGYVE